MPRVVPEYKEDAKRRIVEAALEVIAERGCENMTIDDVAKKLGVTKGAIYWYFDTKEDLFGAVLNKFQTDIQKVIFESYYNRPLMDTLAQIFDRFSLADDIQRAIFFEMIALATRNGDVRHSTKEYYEGLVATFGTAINIEKKQHPGRIETDTHTLALLMTALFSGLQNYELIWMDHEAIRKLWLEGVEELLKQPNTGKRRKEK